MTKKALNSVLARIFNTYGSQVTATTADDIKDLALEYATNAAVSTGMNDYFDVEEMGDLIKEGDKQTALISDQYEQGLITEEERYHLTVTAWRNVDKKAVGVLEKKLQGSDTSVSVMVNSGARGSIDNIKLATAMIGIMVDATGKEIELPIRSSYKKGLSQLEAFVATRGTRKGLIDTALKTADSGYLTRRLVDVSQDVFTVDEEVNDNGFTIYRKETEKTMISFGDRLYSRYAVEAIGTHVKAGELITRDKAGLVDKDPSILEAKIYSILTAKNLRGIPRKSYGLDMATGKLIAVAQPVGVIAAQSVGEPGTQLTLRTFHASGAAGEDITQGLPRVDELFEARAPKGEAHLAEIDGSIQIWEDGNKYTIQITPLKGKVKKLALESRKALVKSGTEVLAGDVLASKKGDKDPLSAPFDGIVEVTKDSVILSSSNQTPVRYEVAGTRQLTIKDGDSVVAGDQLTNGSINLHNLMRLKGVEATQRYIINDVLQIYASQGQNIADKHLEIIVRQMFSRVQIEDPGDSLFVTGDIVSKAAVVEANENLAEEKKELAQYTQLLLGITKVSIWSDSFLSAASFQDTTRVLINAAISGRVDNLYGLKENVIIGRKIPVGTGARELLEEELEEA